MVVAAIYSLSIPHLTQRTITFSFFSFFKVLPLSFIWANSFVFPDSEYLFLKDIGRENHLPCHMLNV